jgi:hypothetical protein
VQGTATAAGLRVRSELRWALAATMSPSWSPCSRSSPSASCRQ